MRWLIAFLTLVAISTSGAPQFEMVQVNGPGSGAGFGGGQYLQQYDVYGCSPVVLTPQHYYDPGAGCPAVSTADWYAMNGVFSMRPYDLLDTACGSVGAKVAASTGRYLWVIGPDHAAAYAPAVNSGIDIMIGFSNDPGILPQSVKAIARGPTTTANFQTATFTGSITSNVLTAGTVTGRLIYTGNQTLTGTGVSTTVGNPISGNASIGKDGTYNATNANAGSTTLTQTQTNVNADYFPIMVCNPDSTSEAFLVYLQVSDGGANPYETGAYYASDPTGGWTWYGPTHISPNGGFEYSQNVVRTAPNTWKSLGISEWPPNTPSFSWQVWTSSDPLTGWDTNGVSISNSVPVPSPPFFAAGCVVDHCNQYLYSPSLPQGLVTTVGAQNYLLSREDVDLVSNSNTGGQFLTLAPVDAGYNAIVSPGPIRISNKYGGLYPGPTFLDTVGGYQEDGILYAFVTAGMFECLNLPACSPPPSPPYNPSNPLAGGGLWQQHIDRYCYPVDSTAALNAAPSGVTASAAAGVVTLSWDNCRPNQNYRIYWGTSPNSFPNVVSPDVTGLSTTITPYLQTPQTVYFKVVSLNSGTEEKSRIVSTYVSSSTKFVNQHIGRMLAKGADPATIDRTWLDSVDALLTAQNLQNYVQTGEDASFGVIQDGSGNVSVAGDLGTTRLPRGGDLTFCTGSNPCNGASTATYSPTAFGTPGTTPGINLGTTNFAYFGNGRTNNIQRKVNYTVCSFYQKPGTATATVAELGASDIGPQMTLQHTSGTPGNASFTLADDVTSQTVTVAMHAVAGPHFICGVFDTTGATSDTSPGRVTVYAEDGSGSYVSGTATPTLHSNIGLSLSTALKGFFDGGSTSPGLGFGSDGIKTSLTNDGKGPVSAANYTYETNQNNFINGATWAFDAAITPTQFTALANAYLNRVTPPTAITAVAAGGISMGSPATYNITAMPSGASATCNGSTDDSAAFTNFNTLAKAWDAANPSATGSIVLNIPNSKCMFLQGGQSIYINKGIVNPSGYAGQARVRILGAGTSSEFSDGGTGGGWFLGSIGEDFTGMSQTKTASAVKGATSVTLSACPGGGCTAALNLFTVGQWARMSGIDMQGPGGNPSNPAFWDYVLVSGKTANDVQFTTTPLRHDYKSTWPSYDASGYAGGPATLYALDASWPLTLEVNQVKLTLSMISQGEGLKGKSITIKNSDLSGSYSASCEVPSENMLFQVINTPMTGCHYEIDKIIDTMILQNVSSIATPDFTSASVKQAIFSEIDATTAMGGSGINTVIANSTIASLQLGPHGFGSPYGQTYVLGSVITAFAPSGPTQSDVNARGVWSGGTLTVPPNIAISSAANNGSGAIRLTVSNTAGWTTNIVGDGPNGPCQGTFPVTVIDTTHMDLQGSTFTATCTGVFGSLPLNWATPGANVYWAGASNFPTAGPVLQVADLSVGANNSTVVSFNQNGSAYAGAFPTIPLPGSGYASAHVHPVPQYFGSGNTGVLDTVTLNPPASAQGLPLGSYYNDVITHANGNPASANTPYIFGQMTETDWLITAACGGASTFEFVPTNSIQTLGSSSTSGSWSPTADATTTSTTARQMFPTTTAGGQSGDSLTAPGANTWLNNGQNEPAYGTIANCVSASTTVTITTNQGVVNPSQF